MALALLICACGRPQPTTTDTPSPLGDLSPLRVDPRQAALAEATAGLIFERDRVLVDPALVRSLDEGAAAGEATRRGYEQLDRGFRVAAIAAFTEAVMAAPRASAPYVGLAEALAAKGRTRDARAAVMTALALEPTHIEALTLLGSLHERLGDRLAGMEVYGQVLAQEPAHGRANARLAVLNTLLGSLHGAREHLAAAQAVGAAVPPRLPGLLAGVELPTATMRSMALGSGPAIGPQRRVDIGAGDAQSNEITAAANAAGTVVAAWNDFREEVRVGVGVSLDGGATWTDFLVRPPVANQSDLEGDPMAAVDPRTGTLWVGGLSFVDNPGIFVARKQAGTATFEPSVMVFEGAVDKPWMAAGRPPTTPDATHLYVAYNQGLQTSADLGESWGPLVALASGIGYLPRVGPSGELHVAHTDFENVRLQTSLDGGASIGPVIVAATRMEASGPEDPPQIPGLFRAPAFNILAVDPTSGWLTFVWSDTTSVSGAESDVDLYLAHSEDGVTWSMPVVLPLPGDQFLPWLEVDTTGRLHMVFLDTRNTAQSDSDTVAFVDVYYAYSQDSGANR